jgi:hypothetical protein
MSYHAARLKGTGVLCCVQHANESSLLGAWNRIVQPFDLFVKLQSASQMSARGSTIDKLYIATPVV